MSTSRDIPQSSSAAPSHRNLKRRIRESVARASLDCLTPRAAMAAAAIFHIVFTLGVFSIGRFGLYPQGIDADGIGQFARDSYRFKGETELLAHTLVQDGVASWLANPLQIHVKLYSLSFVLLGRLLGSNILIAEPVNLLCYLAILVTTFKLTKRIAGQREAWLASAIVAFWPTLLLHTTQFLRDPILIAAFLLLVLVLNGLVARAYTWSRNLIAAMTGVVATLVLWMCRPNMWLVIMAIGLFALVLIAVRIWREKKLLMGNLTVVVLLVALIGVMPQIGPSTEQRTGVSLGAPSRDEGLPLWARVTARRLDFVKEGLGKSGSMIDADVRFESAGDVIKYVPRAVEIGFLAPFPATWLSVGYHVGLVGRLLAGIETLLTYVIELLACLFVWRSRRRVDVWLLVLTVVTGLTALGLVVPNIGTLYRIRYPFWILLVVMGAPVITRWLARRSTSSAKPNISGDATSVPG